MDDVYKTLSKPSSETIFKEKGSKFYGYAFPIDKEDDINFFLKQIKEKHPSARHFCYAWQLGIENSKYRTNDDGEPNNSAGLPIYGQIQSFDVTNVLIISVRYFGGTKLGVGGLIQAYKTSAQFTLEASEIITKTINISFLVQFEYEEMNTVMRFIKEHQLQIKEQELEMKCKLIFEIRKSEADRIENLLNGLHQIQFKLIE